VDITYYDGTGRPIQQIAGKASATGKDIITHIEYDAWGRQAKNYLPYAATTATLAYDSSALANTLAFYNTAEYENTTNPYSEKILEASPLNRMLKQAAPGASWANNVTGNDHTVKFAYRSNLASEVRKFTAIATWNSTNNVYDITFGLTGTTYHSSATLYKTVTQDENKASSIYSGTSLSASNWLNTAVEFKNKEGKLLLKRTFNVNSGTAETMDTYYVYDQFGNLTFVLPPLAGGSTTQMDDLCYQYKYDARNRLVEKKLPGKQWEYIVYDALDRVVASGPALTPFGGTATGWLITKYDAFGRVAYTGWYAASTFTGATRKAMQANAFAVVDKTGTATTIDSVPINYTNTYPTDMKVLAANYYDNYAFYGAPTPPVAGTQVESQPVLVNVKGLVSGRWTRALISTSDTSGETGYTFYDAKGRPVRSKDTNYLGGYTQIDSKLDFEGKTLYDIIRHKRLTGSTELVTRDDFTYTAQDRLLSNMHTIGSGTPQLMAYNAYDELGQLKRKKTGGTSTTGSNPLQQIEYTYNIRGWLKGINDITSLVAEGALVPQDLFAFKINYTETIEQNISGTVVPLYNGNIAETSWRSASDNIQRRYGYSFDKTNRLTDAWYEIPQSTVPVRNSYDEHLTYDKNGNIKTLQRNGGIDTTTAVAQIDNLTYTYTGNSLTKVADSTNSTQGFKDGANTDADFTYDANGNMWTDKNKGISTTNIEYNHLNLPTTIVFDGPTTKKINYIYNAAGEKLKKVVTNGTTIVTTDYIDGYQYQDAVLEFFPTSEGYVKSTVSGGSSYYNYVFQYKDHLGNIRVSYTVDPSDSVLKILEENHYYPFGLKHNGYSATQQMIKGADGGVIRLIPVVNPGDVTFRYRYSGKEEQDELGLNMYDFGARNYDAAIGRWMNIDPLAEKYYNKSTYNYCINNPVYFVDPDGMSIWKGAWQAFNPVTDGGEVGRWGEMEYQGAAAQALVAQWQSDYDGMYGELPTGPGAEFESEEAAAVDFGMKYNALSIELKKEISTVIYSISTSNGKRFSYLSPHIGISDFVMDGDAKITFDPQWESIKGETVEAMVHTHAQARRNGVLQRQWDGFSEPDPYGKADSDISYFNNYYNRGDKRNMFNRPIKGYVITPWGNVFFYDPAGQYGSSSRDKNGKYPYQVPVESGLPSDPDIKKKKK
jgi:RHS repeat-associated protein